MKCFHGTIGKKLIVLLHCAAVVVAVAVVVRVPIDTCSNRCDHRDVLGRE